MTVPTRSSGIRLRWMVWAALIVSSARSRRVPKNSLVPSVTTARGVVDQRVDPAVGLEADREHRAGRAGVGDVEPGGDPVAALGFDQFQRRRAIPQVGGDDPGAGGGEAAGEFLAEAAGCAGDRD